MTKKKKATTIVISNKEAANRLQTGMINICKRSSEAGLSLVEISGIIFMFHMDFNRTIRVMSGKT